MAVSLSPLGGAGAQFFDNSGVPLSGGKIYTYAAGTTTPLTTYTTFQGNVPWTNPIVLDAAGRVPSGGEIWLTNGPQYKFLLKDSNDVLIATYDNITGINGTGIATNANNVEYDAPFPGSYPQTVETKLAETLSVKDFGAVGDGSTDDATAIQAALDAVPETGSLFFPSGTYIVGQTLVINTDNITVYGDAVIKAKNAVSFTTILNASNRTGVTIKGLDLDANGPNRASVQATTYSCLNVGATTDCLVDSVTCRNSRGFGGSAVALAASGGGDGVLRLRVTGCRFLNCGVTANDHPSDGIFLRGRYSKIDNCFAYRVTDTPYVLEGCNYCEISDCVVQESTCFAGITNDMATPRYGNTINGLTGTSNYVGSTGGVIGVACFDAGYLYQTSISNVSIRIASGAGGMGAAFQLRHTGTGRVSGVEMENISIDCGDTVVTLAQGILVQDCDDVHINNSSITMDTDAGSAGNAGIVYQTACVGGIVNDCYIKGAYQGLVVSGTSSALVQNSVFKNQAWYGLSLGDTAVVNSIWNTITGSGLAAINKAVGVTFSNLTQTNLDWSSWVPTLSTDLGDAAFSFSSSTVNLARISRFNNTVNVSLSISVVLNAITPQQIRATLKYPGFGPADDKTRGYAQVLETTGGGTIITSYAGAVRTGPLVDQLTIYKNSGNYTASAPVDIFLTLTYEATP